MRRYTTVETDCPVCGMRLHVPVIEVPGAQTRRTADVLWLIAHFRTHDPGDGGERLPTAA